ncbi:MAG: hypothetical protein J3K34DRAFT_467687 [Monoraphidium minutum]|nr:MAG: hypothetical protein J3K34DRAFT_467687 [Monoraphidium minutum]
MAAATAQALAAAEVQRILAQQQAAGGAGAGADGLPGPPPVPMTSAVPVPMTSAVPPLMPAGTLASVLSSAASVGAAAGGAGAALTAAQQAALRKAREIYIGNLALGQTTAEVLKELFNAALAGFVDNPATQEAVSEVKMDPVAGRFAFVEFISEELASQALTLTGTDVFGKGMKIARPQGYMGPQESKPASSNDKLALAQQLAAKLAMGGLTNVLLLEGLVPAATVRDEAERQEISEMVYEEALRCGRVKGVAVPLPPFDMSDDAPCRVYIKFDSTVDAAKCKDMMDGRFFDDRQITADYVTEVEYNRSAAGEWFTGSIPDAPLMPLMPLVPISGGGMSAPPVPIGGSLTGLPTIQL